MIRRREILKGSLGLSLAGLGPVPALALQPGMAPRFVIDPRLPEAAALRRLAAAGGHPQADPAGEIVALLLADPRWLAPATTLVGLTGYVDAMLARDLLRSHGRALRELRELGPGARIGTNAPQQGPGGALLGPAASGPRRGPTAFLWIA